ncbi:lipase 3 isoform X1 [Anastrepha ludens]|uniref:lipase 3 isoform X1 n=2 Tax=Anastrepha ludens TaxID=28586 RepID=UPI0023AF5948|nr:lipase 3 isoform X1 [Anastrepha ludens]
MKKCAMLPSSSLLHRLLAKHNTQNVTWLTFLTMLLMLFDMQFKRAEALKVTAKMISNHNYPVEEHTVHTPDDYILTIYRIPDSPKLRGAPNSTAIARTSKPVVFLQHGILCASDDWILNGPDTSLAYMFADSGYDVWLGNARGNTYSRQHKHKHPDSSDFWNFSWHEIGVYDLASMLDYVLVETNDTAVHFVAHSQGTTTFFVLMSTLPWYNEKVKTVHLLAPIAFMRNHSFMLSKLGGLFLGYPSFLSWVLGGMELLPITSVQKLLCEYVCSAESTFRFLCSGILDFLGGWGTRHLNHTLLPHVCETHPAGASTTQIIHYLQLYTSGDFRQYDHGIELNKKYYQQETPPSYNVHEISSCVNMFYSDNDYMSAVEDVEYLATLLPCVELYRIPFEDWNHYDFLWSINVKEVINDRIIDKIARHEMENL